MAKSTKQENLPQDKDKRKYVNQSLVPICSLEEALKVPTAILENFGGKPTAPFQVAMAIESTQTSSYWRKLSGSAVAYGLTDGGYNSTKIGLTELALRILAPTDENVDKIGLVEASLKPSVLKQFFEKYNNAKFPKESIAVNVLKLEFNVPAEDAARVLEIIKANGKYTGIIHETKTGPYVFADDPADDPKSENGTEKEPNNNHEEDEAEELPLELAQRMNFKRTEEQPVITPAAKKEKPKVFISHGKNKKIVEQLKEILTFGQFDVIVSVEK